MTRPSRLVRNVAVVAVALFNVLWLVAFAQLGVWLFDMDRLTALVGVLVGEYAWRWARQDAAVVWARNGWNA